MLRVDQEQTTKSESETAEGPFIELVTREVSGPDSTKWSVYFYRDLFSGPSEFNEELFADISALLTLAQQKDFENGFRYQFYLKGVPYLLGIYGASKTIRLGSQRLSFELFAMKNLEKMDVTQRQRLIGDIEFKEFKNHVESLAALGPLEFPSVIDEVTQRYGLPCPWSDPMMVEVPKKSEPLIAEVLELTRQYRPSLFERLSDFALGLTAQYALIRIHLLKFLAILPSLDHDQRGDVVKRMLLEALRRLLKDNQIAQRKKKRGDERALPTKYRLMFSSAYSCAQMVPHRLLARIVRSSVRTMARRFIAGETIEEAKDAFKTLYDSKRDVTVDQLGELVVSEKEADHYRDEVLKLIRGFHLHVPKGEKNGAGIHRAHVSIKVSALCSDFRPEAFEYSYQLVAPRLKEILLAAKEYDVFINIDAEHYDYRDIVFQVYRKLLLETPELKDFSATGIVVQAYLRDGAKHLDEVAQLASERGILMPIRLVKGAYWDAETIDADAHGHVAPEFLNKEETDLHFRQLIIKTFEYGEHLQLCLASHNFADHAFAQQLKRLHFSQAPTMEHQCLHMTYEALSTALSRMGWPVRNYVPVGSLLVGMAYLVRRIMENSSQVGVLTIMRSHKKKTKLEGPAQWHRKRRKSGERILDRAIVSMTDEFLNLTPVRLYLESERKWVMQAYENFKEHGLGCDYSDEKLNGEKVSVFSSSNPQLCVGQIRFATKEDVTRAIDKLEEAYLRGDWSRAPWSHRALILSRAGIILTAQRASLAALISYEAGKSISEALGDVDEAVDFIHFYVRQEGKLHKHNPDVASRGVAAVIAPWNFPLAIPCGMTTASLISGNTAVLKSAEQTPLIAHKMCQIFWQAGVPRDVLIHLPGMGETVGQGLVDDPRVAQLTFTGSKNVGVMIHQKAGQRMIHNRLYDVDYPCKVITEMGGKNAVIVTSNAELDETVAGILYSSFSHAGQKCSAASRVIVEESIKERFIERFEQATRDISVGEAFELSTAVNPVISKEDCERLKAQVEQARAEAQKYGGRTLVDRSHEDLPGYCVGPAVFELPSSRAVEGDSFAMRELFGPVVHIVGVADLDEAIEVFNATPYALTGGVFSQSEDDIEYLTSKMECGNIYVNRSITGARVAIEPFGGFKLSGTGPKAGSRQYLPSFHVTPFSETVLGGQDAPEDGKGSEYDFDLSRPSGLSPKMRTSRMLNALNEMIQHFEALYQGLYTQNKDVLVNYRKWVGREFIDFQTRRHWNRRIPGQLSYSDISLKAEKAVVISYERRPYFPVLMQVLSAVLMGVGVTVMTRNEMAYRWWGQFKNLLARSGFSKENFDVYFVTESLMAQKLSQGDISCVIVDGTKKHVAHVLEVSSRSQDLEKLTRMRLYLSAHDAPHVQDFKAQCGQFAWTRAFAINTVRHGALLDLEDTREN